MTFKDLLVIIVCLCGTMLISCARQGRPSGGPKDTIPPTVIRMNPPLGTTNFKGDELELEFDEYIEVRGLKQELIINPSIEDYKYFTKKQTIVIRLEKDLQENTTYTFNFRQAAVDFENNSARNALIAFSTGDKLDSMQVIGKVKRLKTQEPAENVVVGLYSTDDTINIFNGPPLYFTKTDKNGFYSINYIKEGIYNIYALDDQNGNLEYESNNEAIAFKDSAVYLLQDSVKQLILPDSLRNDSTQAYGQSFDLDLFKKDIRPIRVQSSRPNGKYYEIGFNKPIKAYSLTADSSDLEKTTRTYLTDSLGLTKEDSSFSYVLSNFQEQQQTIRIYNTLRQDSLLVRLSAIDSANQLLDDTIVYVQFAETRRKSDPLTQQLTVNRAEIVDSIKGEITFSKPMISINTDSILLVYDTLFTIPLNYDSLFTWNAHRDKVTFKKRVNKNAIIDKVIDQSAINDSIAFIERQKLEQLYVDSITASANSQEQLRLLQALNDLQNDEEKSQILDSIQAIEDNTLKQNLISGMADTVAVTQNFVPNTYSQEELANSLSPLALYMSPGSFMSVEGDSSEAVRQNYSFLNPDDYGVVKGKIITDQSSYFVQLIDNSFKVIAESYGKDRYSFRLIPPGTYKIRVLIDSNENGKWEEGNILENKEPEPVIVFNNYEINLKANWEQELDLEF